MAGRVRRIGQTMALLEPLHVVAGNPDLPLFILPHQHLHRKIDGRQLMVLRQPRADFRVYKQDQFGGSQLQLFFVGAFGTINSKWRSVRLYLFDADVPASW